jgi:hypothetical protein
MGIIWAIWVLYGYITKYKWVFPDGLVVNQPNQLIPIDIGSGLAAGDPAMFE